MSAGVPNFEPIVVAGKPLETVSSVKVLGQNISCDLRWNVHIQELVKKASSRLYFLRQLKRSSITSSELTLFYVTCIHSILDYACQVYHRALPEYLSNDLERLQKRALRIIYPGLSYSDALGQYGLCTLFERREALTLKLFDEITTNPQHRLHKLLPARNNCDYSLRNSSKFVRPLCKTVRCKKSFVMSLAYSL